MNLHRIAGMADWEDISPTERTTLQKVAAASRGVVTLANLITLVGFGLVVYGLVLIVRGDILLGLTLLMGGRLLDIIDGYVADITRTKSKVGERFDAIADKIGTILTIFVLFALQLAPWWMIVALLVPQVVIPFVIFYKKRRGIDIHPTYEGKISMATAWLAIGGIILLWAIPKTPLLTTGVYALAGASLVLGIYALWQYAAGRD